MILGEGFYIGLEVFGLAFICSSVVEYLPSIHKAPGLIDPQQ